MANMLATLRAMDAFERGLPSQDAARADLVATLDEGVAARIKALGKAARNAYQAWVDADTLTHAAQRRTDRLVDRWAPDSEVIAAERLATFRYGHQLRLANEMRAAEQAWLEARAAAGLTGLPL